MLPCHSSFWGETISDVKFLTAYNCYHSYAILHVFFFGDKNRQNQYVDRTPVCTRQLLTNKVTEHLDCLHHLESLTVRAVTWS